MSNRSLLEFDHDYCPRDTGGAYRFGVRIQAYMRAADPNELPPGVVRKHYRHHTDPDPMVMLDTLAGDLRAAQAREGRLVAALREARTQIEYLHEKFKETGSGNAVLARINSALTRTPDLAAAFRAETESAEGDAE